jgi:hypothetical protein
LGKSSIHVLTPYRGNAIVYEIYLLVLWLD